MDQNRVEQTLSVSQTDYEQKTADTTQLSRQDPGGISSWFAFSNSSYLKGFAAAAGITLLATSPTVREAIVNGGIKAWTFLQAGAEELKEKVQDARAEMGQDAESDFQKG